MTEHTIIRPENTIAQENPTCDAYEVELLSAEGKSVRFGELVTGKGSTITTVVVFIRHFFCVYDQDYVNKVSKHITSSILSTLPNPSGPSQLIIIGCGDPTFIVPYIELTSASFPVYTDPTGRIYEKLSMKRTVKEITQPPSYTQVTFFRALGKTLKQMLQTGSLRALKGGPWNQNGGELIFRKGKMVYAHRMKHVSDHLTAEQLLDILRQDEKG